MTAMIFEVGGFEVHTTQEDDEPRIRDVDLAERLGYERARDIRRLISNMISTGETSGIHVRAVAARGKFRGKTQETVLVDEYWLDEEEALLVCMRSDAPNAIPMRKVVIKVFRMALALINERNVQNRSVLTRMMSFILAPKPADWEQCFHDSLVKALASLDGYVWDGGSHPRYLRSTNRKIYDTVFSSDVGRELKARNPSPSRGSNHSQHLAPDAKEYFVAQLKIVEAIARQSSNKADFWSRMEREYAGGMLQTTFGALKSRAS